MSSEPKAIQLAADISEWLIDKAIKHHGRDFGAALDHVLREAMAREDTLAGDQVPKPVDPWARLTAQARARPTR